MVTLIESANVSDADINAVINQGIDEIAVASDWSWLQETVNITLVDSTQGYALPADFHYAEALIDRDNDRVLPFVAANKFFAEYGGDLNKESTNPEVWTIWEDTILLYPVPSANDADRLTLYYYETPTLLNHDTSDEDANVATPQFPRAFHWILVEYCKWKLWDREEYYDQSERSFITYIRYLNDMMAYDKQRVKRAPYLYGDGYVRGVSDDPNLPLWSGV